MNNVADNFDISSIRETISRYVYGEHHINSKNIEIKYNREAQEVMIKNFYSYNTQPHIGTCLKLRCTGYMDLQIKHPEYHILRAGGNEPKYFLEDKTNHYFLLLFRENPMTKPYTLDKKEILEILKQNPLLVDPSFKLITKYADSGYAVKSLVNVGTMEKHSNTLIIKNTPEKRDAFPISITEKGKIIYLCADFCDEKIFNVTVQHPLEEAEAPMSIDSPDIHRFVGCEKTFRIIEILRRKEKKASKEKFKQSIDMVLA